MVGHRCNTWTRTDTGTWRVECVTCGTLAEGLSMVDACTLADAHEADPSTREVPR